MNLVLKYVWLGVGLVLLSYGLTLFVKEFLPILIVIAVVTGIYTFIFKKNW